MTSKQDKIFKWKQTKKKKSRWLKKKNRSLVYCQCIASWIILTVIFTLFTENLASFISMALSWQFIWLKQHLIRHIWLFFISFFFAIVLRQLIMPQLNETMSYCWMSMNIVHALWLRPWINIRFLWFEVYPLWSFILSIFLWLDENEQGIKAQRKALSWCLFF